MKRTVCVLAIALGLAASAQAQSETGTVAAMVGALQIQRGGAWQAGSIGAPVFTGDRLRTGANDQAKIVFREESVLDMAPNTEILLDTQVFDRPPRLQSLLRLSGGKIRAWVSESYHEARSRYEVETPTAVVRARGTEFIALYDPGPELTDVVCLAGEVEVVGTLGVIGNNVQVGPQLHSQVAKGRFPTTAQPVDTTQMPQYAAGLEIIGTGHRDGLNIQHPAVAGRLIAAQDLPVGAAPTGAEEITVGAPQEFLVDRLSPDVRTNTQPLLDFERTPPGQVPTGSVKVQF
ncbi:MAG: FecR domain-containing protein [Candidatus Binatia bacterium]